MQLSRKLLAFAFLFVILLAALPSLSRAQDGDEDESSKSAPVEADTEYDEESETIEVDDEQIEQQLYVLPSPDVSTWVRFLGVENEGTKFLAGNEVVALIGMHNSGDKTFNVSFVGAHLHSPYDQSFFVQNMTVRTPGALLLPHSETTVEYRFTPDEKLDPLDFHLSGWLIYNDSTVPTAIMYRSLFVNGTVEVLERRGEWTLSSVLGWLIVLGGLAGGAYFYASQQPGGVAGVVGNATGGAVGKKKGGGGSRNSAAASAAAASAAAAAKEANKDAGAASSASATADPSEASEPSPPAVWDTKVYRPSTQQKAVGGKKNRK